MAGRFKLFSNFLKFRIGNPPSDRKDLPIVDKKDELVNLYENQEGNQLGQFYNTSQLNEFRRLSQDRASQYDQFDEMATDSVIAAALEIYADDATQIDERGRIIWVESDSEEITKAGDRLLDIFEIPERAWKHIYCACKYGDYYLKLYRLDSDEETTDQKDKASYRQSVRIVNDKVEGEGIPNYEEYVEDVDDPATIFDLRLRGKTAGFVEVTREDMENNYQSITNTYSMTDVTLYKPDRLVHIMVGEALDRAPEKMTIKIGDVETTYNVAKGKSILHDVYPIQKEIQLLEDALLLNRLTRSSLIRLLEIEVGDMPKKEVNNYLRRMKNLIEQHIAMDKTNGNYKSYQAPGPIDNVIYIPVKNGRGHIDINNLGGDVNVKDIADIDYFNNKRAGALKIPRAYLGEDMDGSGLSNGGSLTKLSSRYARTIMRIQTAYIRAITTLLNLFFIDKKLDYVNKFTVRMTSPATQDDADRVSTLGSTVDLISSIMSLMESLQGETQKKILNNLVAEMLKMPEIAQMIEEDKTPSEDIEVNGESGGFGGGPDSGGMPESPEGEGADMTDLLGNEEESGGEEGEGSETEFSDQEYSEFEDEL